MKLKLLKNLCYVITGILFLVNNSLAQQNQEYITISGDSLSGKNISGEMIREVFGNVKMVQGNVTVFCDHAIQYISKNDAELIGNVVAVQESLTIKTPLAYYFGNEKRAESTSGVELNDKKIIIDADSGSYYFDEHKAVFLSNVKMFDTVSTLISRKLIYYKDENKLIATGNVKIVDSTDVITADSITHFRNDRISIADNNVEIYNTKNNSMIFGDHLEDYAKHSYTLVNKNPLFMQIDTTYSYKMDTLANGKIDSIKTLKLDTLMIASKIMEAFRDTSDLFKAEDSVRIVKGDFASRNDLTIFYRRLHKIITSKTGTKTSQPIMWYENTQLTGDSITIYLDKNRIEKMDIDKNAFILSQNEIYRDRFDQTSGETVTAYFVNNRLSRTDIYGGVHSIYYLYDGDTPNGLTKSAAQNAVIEFSKNLVNIVKLYGSPTSEYYPEKMVKGQELSYTLPGYVLYKNRPDRAELLKIIRKQE
jgi:lipopolysaccharide export system protein LptA